MAVPKSIQTAKGVWKGKSKLNQSWLPPEQQVTESDSQLRVDTDTQSKFATITYDWQYEGNREEGTLILAMDDESNAVQFGWVDSWHQSGGVLYLKGEDSRTGSVKAKGEYGSTEVWGWTIELVTTEDSFTVRMENVTPDGEAIWAVEGVYTRE
jgi:hypothetical protein